VTARRIAIAIGDPAGIGLEVTLKALARPEIAERCRAVLVGDAALIERGNALFKTNLRFGDRVEVLHVPCLDLASFRPGAVSADCGRALIAYAETAIRLAGDGKVDGVIAAPQNQTSVNRAGIPFDGYSGLLARTLGLPDDDVFLMTASERFKIAHVTTHVSIRDALDLVTCPRVLKVIRAADEALRRMGAAAPRIGVSGLNPHAGEHGLWGTEEEREIGPAIKKARAAGLDAQGPFGADVMLAHGGYDAYVVMLHDQGHIPVKLEPGGAGFSIGAPILFATVAHGSAHDIAWQGVADPLSMANAIRWST
jgi:4-hydroxy-L-threonine phosphate dehydrogenase PdxA